MSAAASGGGKDDRASAPPERASGSGAASDRGTPEPASGFRAGSAPGTDSERAVVKVRESGPYKLTGPIVVVDADGTEYVPSDDRPVVLCRCGRSQTKPFCDGTHRTTGFVACERAPR